MTAKEAVATLRTINGNVRYDPDFGILFSDAWVGAYEMAIAVLEKEAAKE